MERKQLAVRRKGPLVNAAVANAEADRERVEPAVGDQEVADQEVADREVTVPVDRAVDNLVATRLARKDQSTSEQNV